ncbi:MAG: LysM peptidoglycan-binding domain-containing protein [Lachnospiraceae bacterium]|nr:LysM peptidoglycan-binding domain-containing protein [Lachnospiraceae bacterium]
MSNIEIYRMKKRAERFRRKKILRKMAVYAALSAVLLAAVIFFIFKSPVQAKEEGECFFKYYSTVRVEKGDSLWGYAQLYSQGSGKSTEEYIDELCSINHISKHGTLRSGTTLTLPYYSTEYICNAD